jgi:hypothetical protein
MNDELRWMWKEAVMVFLNVLSQHLPDGLLIIQILSRVFDITI